MTEKLFQFIWQFQYFNQSELHTTEGEKLSIIHPGKLNHNQGPDFLDAQVKIGSISFAGSIELHIKTSQWQEHGHSEDQNYSNVILHVVMEHNDPSKKNIPVLELGSRVSKILFQRYTSLMDSSSFIPCSGSIAMAPDITWHSWKERLLAERLTRKSAQVIHLLNQNKGHWDEVFWWLIARNFGTKINAHAFEEIARSVPLNILLKHKNQLQQLEALLLGQAGLLDADFKEDYPRLLQREFQFLKKKYNLKAVHTPVHFLRMRPVNFPTIRLAQLAVLVQTTDRLFASVLEMENVSEIKERFSVTANDYWHYHYLPDETSAFQCKTLGKSMIENIVINTIVPLLFTYGLQQKEQKFKEKALRWLEEISAESNSITKGFAALGLMNRSAFDSQSLIELKTNYCDQKKCLGCAIGNAILKKTNDPVQNIVQVKV